LLEQAALEEKPSLLDDFIDILELIGNEHKDWLKKLLERGNIQQEPLIAEDGEILAEPVFWFQDGDKTFACFGGEPPGKGTSFKLEDARIKIINPGEDWTQNS
jgi:hypothetical protein